MRLCIPSNVTPERKRILRAYGAEIVFTDPLEGSDGAIRQVRRVYAADPGPYFYPDQVQQPGQLRAHYDTTGPEMLAQTDGRMTHFVAGLGTSGTFMGAGRFFRDQKPHVQLDVGAARYAAARSRGAQAHGVGNRPGDLRSGLADLDMRVATEDAYKPRGVSRLKRACWSGSRAARRLSAGLRVAARLDRPSS